MRVHATLHGFAEKERDLELAAGATADDAPRALGVRPELVLVFRDDRPLPSDAPLADGDRVRILRVVSGGARPPRARALALALAALTLLLLLPAGAADHVYSHRFVVDGRLVGSDGLPLPGREMEFVYEGDEFLEPCREGMRTITDEFGDFEFCYHKHDLSPAATAGVRYGNVSEERTVDVATRRASMLLREPNETGVAPPGWNETYRISGRAWKPGPIVLEGVQVFGEAVIDLPVNLTIHFEDGSEQVFHSRTDGFGDFDLVVETEADPSLISVTLEAKERAQPVQLDTVFHRTFAPVFVGLADPPPAQEDRSRGLEEAPGTSTPRMNPVLLVALAVALVAALLLSRRKKA